MRPRKIVLSCAMLATAAMSCSQTTEPCCATAQVPAKHHALLVGMVQSEQGVPLDSVAVFVTLPASRHGYAYLLSPVLSSADGKYELTVQRVVATVPEPLPVLDTITATVAFTALKSVDQPTAGAFIGRETTVLLNFAPISQNAHVTNVDIRLAVSR